MSSDEIEQWIREHGPVDQDRLVEEFGQRGLLEARELMKQNRISYSLDWKLLTEADRNG